MVFSNWHDPDILRCLLPFTTIFYVSCSCIKNPDTNWTCVYNIEMLTKLWPNHCSIPFSFIVTMSSFRNKYYTKLTTHYLVKLTPILKENFLPLSGYTNMCLLMQFSPSIPSQPLYNKGMCCRCRCISRSESSFHLVSCLWPAGSCWHSCNVYSIVVWLLSK